MKCIGCHAIVAYTKSTKRCEGKVGSKPGTVRTWGSCCEIYGRTGAHGG